MKTLWITCLTLLILTLIAAPVHASIVSVGAGYHPEADKQVIVYLPENATTATLYNSTGPVTTLTLATPTDAFGGAVACQGGVSCLIGDFSQITAPGTYHVMYNGTNSPTFIIDETVHKDMVPTLLEFFAATVQQNSPYHEDFHANYSIPFPFMADGSFILESHQAAIPLIRLGSAYRANPELFTEDTYTLTATNKPDLLEYIYLHAAYLKELQGVQIEETSDGFRLNPAMTISNAFVPGNTNQSTLDVFIPGNPPVLLETVNVTSMCGNLSGTAYDNCIAEAATLYKCQENETCLNMTYVEKTGSVVGHEGYAVPRGWGYEFGCFNDVDPFTGMYNEGYNPCHIFYNETNALWTSMTFLAYMQALPALDAYDNSLTETYMEQALGTKAYLEGQVLNNEEQAHYGAALFLLYNYTGNTTYLEEAHALRASIPITLVSDGTNGNEFYWEEYVRHKDALLAANLTYAVSGTNPEEFLRGKMYYDWKDSGAHAMSKKGEWVYEFDNNIQFQNSRYILTEAVLASKAANMYPVPEGFIITIAERQLAFLTGMNAVQQGVALNSTLASQSFIFGIGDFPVEFHNRMTINTTHTMNSNGTVVGARGTALQQFNGTDYVYLDGRFSILGEQLGSLGNGYNNETQIRVFDQWKAFVNNKTYIPGWINGPFDTFADTDVIFNYDDNVNTYEFTESTNEITATAIELLALLDARHNNKERHPGLQLTTNSTNETNASQCFDSVYTLPATCEGDIVSDEAVGCRALRCENSGAFIEVLACNKPGDYQPTRFEMYKTAGGGVELCLGNTCLKNNGFASGDLPYCAENITIENATLTVVKHVVNDNNGTKNVSDFTLYVNTTVVVSGESNEYVPGTYVISEDEDANYTATFSSDCAGGTITLLAGENKTCVITNNDVSDSQCYDDLSLLPATCNGNITKDQDAGCRAVSCTDGVNSLDILACEKPDGNNPARFEMYKQGEVGSGIEICLGDACISNEGFKSVDLPHCVEELMCTDSDGDGYAINGGACGVVDCADTNASINPGAIEICNGIDDNCDGNIDETCAICGNNVTEFGEQCDDGNLANGDGCSASCQIEVNASVTLDIAPWYPQGMNYIFQCNAEGFSPSSFDWDFGDGDQQFGSENKDVWHTFTTSGNFTVTCTASDGSITINDSLNVST